MSVAVRGGMMERKRISISSKRQVTIPQKFFDRLGFADEAECILNGSELIIRPVREQGGTEFAEQILADLIAKGLSGNTLLEQFKLEQKKIRPAVERMIADADELAASVYHGPTVDELLSTEE